MKIYIDVDEMYPYYLWDEHASRPDDESIEVPDETVARWQRVLDEFDQMQKEMREFYQS